MKHFERPVKVYYADTDAIGIIYHANYFKYFEMCRSDWAEKYMPIRRLTGEGLLFVVDSASIKFRKPGRVNDILTITMDVVRSDFVSAEFAHTVKRGDEVLVEANIRLACVNKNTLRLERIPDWYREKIL
jgi:acyl-CoA thioester hydrolase